MITGLNQSVIDSLREHPDFTFTLTGSRAYGSATKYSDTDFFAEYSKEIETFLREHNFILKDASHYYRHDPSVVKVLHHVSESIDVQLIHPVWYRAKKLIHEQILDRREVRDFLHATSKEEHRLIWRSWMLMARVG